MNLLESFSKTRGYKILSYKHYDLFNIESNIFSDKYFLESEEKNNSDNNSLISVNKRPKQ